MPPENKPESVTLVTRNEKGAWIELVLVGIGFYYITHPDVFDEIRAYINRRLDRIVYRLSVWQTWQRIRNLPEIDER